MLQPWKKTFIREARVHGPGRCKDAVRILWTAKGFYSDVNWQPAGHFYLMIQGRLRNDFF
ncbi:hypothetical protein AZI85_10495 [Bdellovibrio bacteriovorus]|uniref:Uncharacterized protein n=1 Tax=Bdellovibrio bacteriovorus TaxID=959 RepID=A0A150WDB0_BDEBC|nr:hypothetical protein AZI85_10495 [Bdellovibrio bacteriovorus]